MITFTKYQGTPVTSHQTPAHREAVNRRVVAVLKVDVFGIQCRDYFKMPFRRLCIQEYRAKFY